MCLGIGTVMLLVGSEPFFLLEGTARQTYIAGKLGAFSCALGKTIALDMRPETTLQTLH